MNEPSMNQWSSTSVAVVKTDTNGQKVIQKKQRVKILQNILAMNAKHNLSFNRLLWLEARFHGKLHFIIVPINSYALLLWH
jgi:stringent starvation protein B